MTSHPIMLAILLLGIFSCSPNKPLAMDYCEMLQRDQSFVDREETDPAKRERNHLKRQQLFIENYEQIIQCTKREGFPKVRFAHLPQDSCKYWAVTMTLIHTAQTKPEIFFGDESISLFNQQIKKGNLEPEVLAPAFRVSFTTNEFCDDLEESIRKAIKIWGMESYLNKEPKFKKCD